MNDTVDILKIKESEFGSANIGTIGDLNGYEFKAKYGATKKLQLQYARTIQEIEFIGSSLTNTRDDIFLRYNIFQNSYSTFNSGISIDFGFTQNKLDTFHVNNIYSVDTNITINSNNELLKRVPNLSTQLSNAASKLNTLANQNGMSGFKILDTIDLITSGNIAVDNDTLSTYDLNSLSTNEINLLKDYVTKRTNGSIDGITSSTDNYVSLEDFGDRSFYIRLLTGINTKSSLYDFYVGYKITKITGNVTLDKNSLAIFDIYNKYYPNSTIPNLPLDLNREEKMLFAGFNITSDWKYAIMEFGYEYERMFRDQGLDYINFNHIINLTLNKPITKNFLVFAGAKIMYRQFNGQIPYLYNEYFQSTFDHKYGYARFGLKYIFNL